MRVRKIFRKLLCKADFIKIEGEAEMFIVILQKCDQNIEIVYVDCQNKAVCCSHEAQMA